MEIHYSLSNRKTHLTLSSFGDVVIDMKTYLQSELLSEAVKLAVYKQKCCSSRKLVILLLAIASSCFSLGALYLFFVLLLSKRLCVHVRPYEC